MTALIMLLVYLLVGAIVLYLIKLVLDLFPLPATIRQIIIVILALIVLLWVISHALGVNLL